MTPKFDHEKLEVYQQAIRFTVWTNNLLPSLKAQKAIKDQLDRASISIPLNIAEGNGKFTSKDRCRFFDIARGSALECAACIDTLCIRKAISTDTASEGKTILLRTVRMLVGLIRTTSKTRVHEDPPMYNLIPNPNLNLNPNPFD